MHWDPSFVAVITTIIPIVSQIVSLSSHHCCQFCLSLSVSHYSRIPVTQTFYISNLPLTRSNLHFPSDCFLYNFTLNNSNSWLLKLLKIQIIWSQLYFVRCWWLLTPGFKPFTIFTIFHAYTWYASWSL